MALRILNHVTNTSDADKPVSTAQAAWFNSARHDFSAQGRHSAGESEALIIPAGTTLQRLGMADFCLLLEVQRETWNTGSECVLIDAISSNTGWRLSLTADFKLRLQIGNGTDLTTYDYTSPSAIASIGDNDGLVIQLSAQRDLSVSFWVNRASLGHVLINDSLGVDIPSNIVRLLSDGSTHYEGTFYRFVLNQRAMSDSEIISAYDAPRLMSEGGPARSWHASFAGATPSGVSALRGTLTSNQDGIYGEDDCALYEASTDDGVHLLNISGASGIGATVAPIAAGEEVLLSSMALLPSGNENIDSMLLRVDGNGTDISSKRITMADNEWVRLKAYSASNAVGTVGNSAGFYIRFNAGSSSSFAGGTVDDAYAKAFHCVVGRRVLDFDTSDGGNVLMDRSGNNRHAYTGASGVTDVVQSDTRSISFTAAADGWVAFDQTSRELFDPSDWMIESIVLRNTTANAITDLDMGYTSVSAEVIAATDLPATCTQSVTLVTQFPTTGKLHLHANAGTGAWNSGEVSGKITLIRKP